MAAVVYKMGLKKDLNTIVGVQCILTVFCYDKVRFIIVKYKKEKKTFIFTNLNLIQMNIFCG